MSDDLVTPLRNAAYLAFEDGTNDYTTPALAAARIAELETENAALVANQTPFDELAAAIMEIESIVNKARAALTGEKKDG